MTSDELAAALIRAMRAKGYSGFTGPYDRTGVESARSGVHPRLTRSFTVL